MENELQFGRFAGDGRKKIHPLKEHTREGTHPISLSKAQARTAIDRMMIDGSSLHSWRGGLLWVMIEYAETNNLKYEVDETSGVGYTFRLAGVAKGTPKKLQYVVQINRRVADGYQHKYFVFGVGPTDDIKEAKVFPTNDLAERTEEVLSSKNTDPAVTVKVLPVFVTPDGVALNPYKPGS